MLTLSDTILFLSVSQFTPGHSISFLLGEMTLSKSVCYIYSDQVVLELILQQQAIELAIL